MILIENVLNLDGFRTSILIEGNKILKVQTDLALDLPQNTTVIDGSGMLGLSGFFNAHTHAAMTAFRQFSFKKIIYFA
jgi:5-methylthioadenosine/S-adenosylhomocysteine deaminase